MPPASDTFSFSTLWAASRDSLRSNVLPGVLLSLVGLGVVFLYFQNEAAREALTWVGEQRVQYGFLYSGLATAFYGGLIPFLFLRATGQVPRGQTLSWAGFLILFWAWRGIEVDAFYRLQAWLFGSELNPATIATKVLVDQFIYCPLWSAPITTFFYAWRDANFSRSALRPRLGRSFFTFEVPSVLLGIWVVWIPATSIIYSLPLPLQIPLFNLVLCFYVLTVSALTLRNHLSSTPDGDSR